MDKDVDRTNYNEEKESTKKTKEEMPKNLSFVKGFLDSDNLDSINVNTETLQDSNIIKVVSKKLVRKAIEMMHKLAEKEKYKKEKDDKIGYETKEVNINENREVADMDNEELDVDAVNDPPHRRLRRPWRPHCCPRPPWRRLP